MKRFSTPVQTLKHCCCLLLLCFALLAGNNNANGQGCNTSITAAGTNPTACGTNYSVLVGAGEAKPVTFTSGVYYTFTFSANAQSSLMCIGGSTQSSPYTTNGLSGAVNIGANRTSTTWTSSSATLTYTITSPTLGSPSNAGPIDYCDATGTFGSALTANSTANGSVNWDWGSSDGTWHNNWVGGTSSGTCCFPKKVGTSNSDADRIRYHVDNGACTAGPTSAILLRNHYNEAPSSLASTSSSYCLSSKPSTITLTATFPTATDILGTVKFYSGSCGGTLVASIAGNGSTTVSSGAFTSPSATTTYYALYDPGTGTGCSVTGCVNTTVTVFNDQTLTLTGGVNSPTLCKSSTLGTNTVYTAGGGATGISLSGSAPAGMSFNVSGTTFTISGTPSVAGSFPYTITTTGAGSCAVKTVSGTVTVNDIQTMSLTGGVASPSICKSSALGTNTVYTFGGGATSANISAGALPAGMSGNVVGTTFVISGTPTVVGSFAYTVTSSGTGNCSPVSLGGTITVNDIQSMSLTGGVASPTLCKSTALGTNTVYTFGGGATSASITAGALPAGMLGSIVGTTFVISGTPTVAGSFPYTVTSSGTGNCSPVSLGGTITVNDIQSMSLTGGLASPTLCKSTALGTNTVYTFGGGATSASITAGALPAGMNGNVVGSTFVISGTPTVSGSFPYTVTSSGAGNCSPVSLGGTITVNNTQSMSLTGGVASPTICQNATLGTNTVYTFGGGATSASITAGALPAGMSGSVVGTTFVISGTPSAAGSFPYTVTSSGAGSCSPVSLGGTITVNATPTPTFTVTPTPPVCTGYDVTYTTQSGQSSYVWGGFGSAGTDYTITSGGLSSTDNTVTLKWVSTGTKSITVGYSTTGCPSATPASTSTVVNASPSPTVSNSGAYCTSNTIVYSTASGQSSYVWATPGSTAGTDYTVIAGGSSTDNTWTLQWISTGSRTVTANYTNAAGCAGPTAGGNTGTVSNGPSSASIADVIDGCNGGHTATVTVTGGTSPYNFTVCGTPYTAQTSPFALDATSNTSCSLTLVSDAAGCVPGTISGSPVTYPTRTLTAGDTYACMVTNGGTKIFYDNSGNLMVKIIDGGSGLGNTTVVASVDGTLQKFGPSHPQSYLQRHFKITPTNANSASVCLYMSDAEVSLLHDSSATDNHSFPSYYPTVQTNLSNAVVTKFHGGSETPISNTSRQVLTPTSKTHNPTVNGVTYNNVWEVCMNVTSWSGFYLHGQNTNNTPLPVTFLYLTADAVNNKYIQLDWATASEINNQGFEIQRSTDGVAFERIGFIDGHGNSNSTLTYSYDDRTVQPGAVYYYRLKQIDIDGQSTLTEIVSASLLGDKGFVFEDLIPNPAVNSVQLGILTSGGQKATVSITDMLGRVVMTTPWQLAEGYNISTFDISDLADGAYNVTVYSGTTYTTKRLVVTK